MKLLQLCKISDDAVASVVDSFDRLPHTDHKDGKYRLRRYSVVELRTSFWNAQINVEVEKLDHREFSQDEHLNRHQGGMVRNFEEIEDEVLQSVGMKEILLSFKEANKLHDGQEVEIHQMRVSTQKDGTAKTSPEGVHQDGFDYIAMIGISRHNISGGELLAYKTKKSNPFLNYALNGEMVMIKDDELWHNATPIVAYPEREEQGYGDWFILTAIA